MVAGKNNKKGPVVNADTNRQIDADTRDITAKQQAALTNWNTAVTVMLLFYCYINCVCIDFSVCVGIHDWTLFFFLPATMALSSCI